MLSGDTHFARSSGDPHARFAGVSIVPGGMARKLGCGKSVCAMPREDPATNAPAAKKAVVTDLPRPPLAPVISTTCSLINGYILAAASSPPHRRANSDK